MGSPYTSTSVSGYNANPPPDDGTTVATNKITWAGVKSKIGDPLNTFASTVDSNLTTAFGKCISGASVVSTAVDYPAGASDQGRLIVVTVSGKTVTTPDAGTVHSPFVFAVANQSTGTITLAGNAAGSQTVDGQTTQVIKAGSGCLLWTDGSNWFTSGLKYGQIQSTNPPYGFDSPINLQLNASVGSNLLTIAVKTNSGADPTASDPVLIPFRDSTIANGDPVWQKITSALSINTNGVGATLGSSNSVPFRFWIVAFDNSGTVVLGLVNCSTQSSSAVTVFPLAESIPQSTTAISAAATSAGVFYTPNGTTLTSKSFRVLGWLEYASGLATAGTYGSAPTKMQLFGAGHKKPGDVVQASYVSTTTVTTTTANTTTKSDATNMSLSISPTSAVNPVKVTATGTLALIVGGTGSSNSAIAQLFRGTDSTPIGNMATVSHDSGTTTQTVHGTAMCFAFDNPQTTSSTTYGLFIQTPAAVASQQASWLNTSVVGTNTGTLMAEEIMG